MTLGTLQGICNVAKHLRITRASLDRQTYQIHGISRRWPTRWLPSNAITNKLAGRGGYAKVPHIDEHRDVVPRISALCTTRSRLSSVAKINNIGLRQTALVWRFQLLWICSGVRSSTKVHRPQSDDTSLHKRYILKRPWPFLVRSSPWTSLCSSITIIQSSYRGKPVPFVRVQSHSKYRLNRGFHWQHGV